MVKCLFLPFDALFVAICTDQFHLFPFLLNWINVQSRPAKKLRFPIQLQINLKGKPDTLRSSSQNWPIILDFTSN